MSTHFAIQVVDSIETKTSYIRKYGDYRRPKETDDAANTVKPNRIKHRYESLDASYLDEYFNTENL